MDYLTVAEGIEATGLRLVLTAGVPGPWGESLKAILRYKGLAFTPVQQEGGGENAELQAWTGQSSAPVIVLDQLPPVSHWLDQLMFTERLAPEPALVPERMAERVQALGLAALIAGPDGFGWTRRLHMLTPMMVLPEPPEMAVRMAEKYGWSEAAQAASNVRLRAISDELNAQLVRQAEQGSPYFVGTAPTAPDFYWAAFSNLIKPLPQEVNPMPDFLRATYSATESEVLTCLTTELERHRDMMFERHIALPLDY